VQAADAVGGGFVSSLSPPGGNATGLTNFDFNFSTKWLELLRQIAPRTSRVAMLQDPSNPSGAGQVAAIEGAATSSRIEVVHVSLRDAGEMERGIDAFAREPHAGLIVIPSGPGHCPPGPGHFPRRAACAARNLSVSLHRRRLAVSRPDVVDQYRRAAGYVDRILRGSKPADLPVQQSSKIEMAVNLRTARRSVCRSRNRSLRGRMT
jgi:putative ABC transport system substrate-binding protein